MIQRMQMECDRCHGKGEIIPEGNKCNSCRGGGLKKETKVLAVEITRGMKNNEKIVFNEEGDQHPDTTPGDVVVVLKQAEHPIFTRTPDGCHLYVKKNITLLEALTGFQLTIEHLDGRVLIVNSEEGQIYQKGDVKAIREEGFPLRNSSNNGHIYITINVTMPPSLDQKTRQGLRQILQGVPACVQRRPEVQAAQERLAKQTTGSMNDDDVKGQVSTYQLESVDVEAEKRTYAQLMREEHAAYDSDNEEQEGAGPQQATCRTQ